MNQLSLPIQEFYLALPDTDRQYAQEQAQEIRLEQHNTAVRIGNRLIAVKERLGHGNFGKWIELEFQWSDRQARTLMKIASELGERKDTSDLPTATMPLYALASALSKEDEEGKQEILQAYHEKAEEKGSALSEKEIKELREKLRQKEGEVTQLKQANQFVTSELQKQKELLTGVEATLQDSAKSLAEKMAETEVKKATVELRNEVTQLKAEKQRLENNQALAESNMTKAKEDYEKALDKFKNNPDPDTKKKLDELQTQYRQMQVDVQQATFKLQNLKEKEDQAFSASFELERFFGNFNKLIANHPDAITAMGSRYLTDSSLSKLDSLANTLEYWAETIRKSIALARSDNATAIRSVDVEVLEDEDDEF